MTAVCCTMGFCENQAKPSDHAEKWLKRNKMDIITADFDSEILQQCLPVDNNRLPLRCNKFCNQQNVSSSQISGVTTYSCEHNGLLCLQQQLHTISKRPRASANETEPNSKQDVTTSSLLRQHSDHVSIPRFLNRPSREILATEYPHLLFPNSNVCNYSRLASFTPDLSTRNLDFAYTHLSRSGWYYGPLTVFEARTMLKQYSNGTFLLRDSSDPKHLFSLSVKTQRGTTSIRIRYDHGQFSLEAEPGSECSSVSFNCVMKLIENYVVTSSHQEENYILLETSGRMDTPFAISRGCTQTPGSLKHLCRKTLNANLNLKQRERLLLFMSPEIENYMTDYPFTI